MNNEKKTLIVIPCFNCEKQIVRVLDKVHKSLNGVFSEVLIVENQSTRDNTLDAVCKKVKVLSSSKFKVIQNDKNYGLGGSHKVALSYALEKKFDYIAFIHGDDQTSPAELRDLLKVIYEDHKASAVLGARFMKGSRLYGYDFKRKLANKFLTFLYTLLTGRKTYELGAGLSIHRVSDFKDGDYRFFTDDFNFYCFMLLDYYSKKRRVIFYPISYYETDQISNVRNLHIGWITLKCVLRWRFLGGLEKHSVKDYSYKSVSI